MSAPYDPGPKAWLALADPVAMLRYLPRERRFTLPTHFDFVRAVLRRVLAEGRGARRGATCRRAVADLLDRLDGNAPFDDAAEDDVREAWLAAGLASLGGLPFPATPSGGPPGSLPASFVILARWLAAAFTRHEVRLGFLQDAVDLAVVLMAACGPGVETRALASRALSESFLPPDTYSYGPLRAAARTGTRPGDRRLQAVCGLRRADLALVLREVAGDPWAPPAPAVPEDVLRWNGGVVPALARKMRAGEDVQHTAEVLADALDDAGCPDPSLARHLREPWHLRECRVARLLCGRPAGGRRPYNRDRLE